MPESPSVPLKLKAADGDAPLQPVVPVLVAAEILRLEGDLYWAILDIDPERQVERPQERRLRLWRISADGTAATPRKERSCTVDAGREASLCVVGKDLFALVAVNSGVPAKLLRWRLTGFPEDAWQGLESAPVALDVGLPPEVGWTVKISPQDRWSTAGLTPAAWVFNPRLRLAGGKLLAALETADGRSSLLELNPKGGPVREHMRPVFPAVDVVAVQGKDRPMVFGRGPDAGWSGFFDNPLLSFRRGPLALPLVAGAQAGEGVEYALLRETLAGVTGVPCYALDVATRPDGRQVLAMVVGERLAPMLMVFGSLDGPRSASLPLLIPLAGMIARLRVIATDSHVSICVVFAASGKSRVEFQLGGLDPVTEESGIRQRLENVGCLGEGMSLEEGVRAFQKMEGLEETGVVDDALRSMLQEKAAQ